MISLIQIVTVLRFSLVRYSSVIPIVGKNKRKRLPVTSSLDIYPFHTHAKMMIHALYTFSTYSVSSIPFS